MSGDHNMNQKPVAWMYDFLNSDNRDEVIRDWVTQSHEDIKRENGFNVRPLYTTPPAAPVQEPVECMCGICKLGKRQWVGLTRNEAMEIINSLVGQDWRYAVDAIEAKLKQKNNG